MYHHGSSRYQGSHSQAQQVQEIIPRYDFDCGDGVPIQFIYTDSRSNQIQLNEEATQHLSQFPGNIGFVSIIGQEKSGKSFLINKILGLEKGFEVHHKPQKCTEGIWMWSKPVYLEKDNMNLFFIDCQPIIAHKNNDELNVKILTLTFFMSSYLIINTRGALDDTILQSLYLFTEISRVISTSEDGNTTEYALSFYAPKLMWVLRDYQLNLTDTQGRPLNPNQYLESTLMDIKGPEQIRKIKQSIATLFRDRDLLILPAPTDNKHELNSSDVFSNSKLQSSFVNELYRLKDKLLKKCPIKQLNGLNLKPRMFTSLVQDFVSKFNENEVPNIIHSWDYMMEFECNSAYNAAIEIYNNGLKEKFENQEREKNFKQLFGTLKNLRDISIAEYNEIAMIKERNSDLYAQYLDQLRKYISEKEELCFKLNDELAETSCKDVAGEAFSEVQNKFKKNRYNSSNIHELVIDLKKAYQKYDEGTTGKLKSSVFIDTVLNINEELLPTIFEGSRDSVRRHEDEKKNAAQKVEQQEKELDKKRNELNRDLNSINDERQTISSKKSQMNSEIEKLKQKKIQIIESHNKNDSKLKKLREDLAAKSEEVKQLQEKKAIWEKKKNCNIF